MPDPAAIDRLIQTYDSKFGLDDRTKHSALAVELLGGRANRATGARANLEAAIAGSDASTFDPNAVALLAACNDEADMARAALEYQIRINTHILGYPEGNLSSNLFGGS